MRIIEVGKLYAPPGVVPTDTIRLNSGGMIPKSLSDTTAHDEGAWNDGSLVLVRCLSYAYAWFLWVRRFQYR